MEWHEDQLIVSVGVSGVQTGVAVGLPDDPEPALAGGGRRCAHCCLVGVDVLGAAVDCGHNTGENEEVVANLPAGPPHKTFMGCLGLPGGCEKFLGSLHYGPGKDEVADGWTLG